MKVVYHCYGGAHSSPTAAAIHLGYISDRTLPSFSDFKKIPFFDAITNTEHGKMIEVGLDRFGNRVYILARRNAARMTQNIIKGITEQNGGSAADFFFVSCVQLLNPFMVTGGFSSRAMGWVGFGRPMVTFGTILSFPMLVMIVHRTLRHLANQREMNSGL